MILKQDYCCATLSNGLRVAIASRPGAVSYIGLVVNAGSRDERDDRQGLAHFVEHTIFKGTPRRRSWHIANRMEMVGGELNAYTSKEETMIYTNAPAGHESRALDLIADLAENSIFPLQEIDREREVIVEEIKSYLDSPADSVYDRFEELLFEGSPLAHNILGTPESVHIISPEDCRGFLKRHYRPRDMVLYIWSPLSEQKALRAAERYFGNFPERGGATESARPSRTKPETRAPFNETIDSDGHQAHTIVGTRTFSLHDPRRFPLFLLNNYLGGPCMNSRLNRELRDRRGLVYTVDSSVSLLSDTGLMQIYFGSDRSTVGKCKAIIRNELDRLAQSPLAPRLFERVKEQYCGQLTVSSDNRESVAMSMGKSLMYYGKIRDIATSAEEVRAVTPEQVRQVAELLCDTSALTLT